MSTGSKQAKVRVSQPATNQEVRVVRETAANQTATITHGRARVYIRPVHSVERWRPLRGVRSVKIKVTKVGPGPRSFDR